MRNAPDFRIAAAARGFVLLALGGPILWGRDVASLVALAALGTGWLLALNLEMRAPRLRVPLVVLDAGFVGLVAGTELGDQAVLGALAVPPFVAGLWRGLRGVLLALSAELIAVVVVGIASGGPLSADQSFAIFTWAAMAWRSAWSPPSCAARFATTTPWRRTATPRTCCGSSTTSASVSHRAWSHAAWAGPS